MASETDTAELVRITHVDLQWLVFAVRNVQTRCAGEMAVRTSLISRFDIALENNPTMPEFHLSFTKPEALICLFAANEGRCRTCDEMLTRGRMQRVFNEYTGGHWGVNNTA
jgi:hypothetical protein